MRRVLLLGPPGSGKVTRARAMTRALPPVDERTALEQAWIVYGARLRERAAGEHPFRAPHHTCSEAALIGGGHWARPGEASLAHGGALLLDELAEFRESAINALAHVLNAQGSLCKWQGTTLWIPARPQLLIASSNACPCGHLGVAEGRSCSCSRRAIASYTARIASYAERLGIAEIIPCRPYTVDEIQRGLHLGGES
jgi:magnesium chelatase family protein